MKRYILNLIPFMITAGCLMGYNIIGSKVLSDGTLVEPFYLIPIAWLFLLIGIIGATINFVIYLKNKKINI